jgi:hypothetical protein
MNSLFYPKLAKSRHGYNYANVKRWTKKNEIFSQDMVIVPIHCGGNHWTLAIVNIRQQRFEYYDSLQGSQGSVFRHLRQWLQDESKDKHKRNLNLSEWKDICYKDGVPIQQNSYDCGVFMCKSAEYIAQNGVLDFGQDNINCMRRNMVLELLSLSIINLPPAATNPVTTSLAPTPADNATSAAAPVSVDTDDAGAVNTPTSAPLHTTNAALAGIREQGGTREEEDNGAGVGITNRPQGVFRAPFKGQQTLHYLDQVPPSSETHAGEEEPEHAPGK